MFIRFVVFCAALVILAAIIIGLLVINREYGAVPAFVGLASVLLVGVWVVRDKGEQPEDKPSQTPPAVIFKRIAFWTYFIAGTGILVGGVAAAGKLFGLPGLIAGIVALYILYLWSERRKPIYFDDGDLLMLGGDSRPALPPPGAQALPAPGPKQITRSQRPALPGPKSRDLPVY